MARRLTGPGSSIAFHGHGERQTGDIFESRVVTSIDHTNYLGLMFFGSGSEDNWGGNTDGSPNYKKHGAGATNP
jgi:hypothetical protein